MSAMLRGFFFAIMVVVGTTAAVAHSVKWHNGTTYDYDVLLAGKDCCGGSHCRPAYAYKMTATGWKLRVPDKGDDPNSEPQIIEVVETGVTYKDLNNDGVAHACGYWNDKHEWQPYCTYIPRVGTA